ncbi:uncharacterized protein LOC112523314 [Cynara cardunculus var. scolymus]|uniref:Uncharacterized protein n=1 Tax=Cynara cardunculus var. scolymus TaxID=59895 RepID=A0A124SDF1_CYNCS|nr:uncharacterized protein LOC112523314 [Cynara cardunculus var. scolymus]KVH96732.1 Protein of unknown function DUF506, plant [Cynara cardunculus var. scolymus]
MGRFPRMAEAFDQVAAKVRDCDSSGSEHSPETMMDLSDLVNSFIENGNGFVDSEFDSRIADEYCTFDGIDEDLEEMKESLNRLFRFEYGDDVRKKLVFDVEKAWHAMTEDRSSPPSLAVKRQLMARLRDQGLDAGLCKSKWEKKGRLLAGDYEYVDVNVGGIRYIIIISLREEFKIARPTDNYTSVLEILPRVSVCTIEELKETVRIICKAIKKSMNQMKMAVPPWRRREYVQAKWFGSYKRTTNEFSTKDTINLNENKTKIVGFVSLHTTWYGRRKEDFARKDKIGNLAMAINGAS